LYRRFWLYPKLNRFLSGRVLDVGCGIGDFLRFRPQTIGVDINPINVDWCLRHGLDAHLMSPDVLPFHDCAFDCVILDNVLEHLESPELLILEINRVLLSSGLILVGVPGQKGFASDSDHKIFYDKYKLDKTFNSFGLISKKYIYMPFRSAWLDFHVRQYCIYGVFGKR
jgi:SAM-dependent methyltransferase